MKIVEWRADGTLTYDDKPIKGLYPSRRTGEDIWVYLERLAQWCDKYEES